MNRRYKLKKYLKFRIRSFDFYIFSWRQVFSLSLAQAKDDHGLKGAIAVLICGLILYPISLFVEFLTHCHQILFPGKEPKILILLFRLLYWLERPFAPFILDLCIPTYWSRDMLVELVKYPSAPKFWSEYGNTKLGELKNWDPEAYHQGRTVRKHPKTWSFN